MSDNVLSEVSYGEFFDFSIKEFSGWLSTHMSMWLKDPFAHNLFTPRPSIGHGRGGDIFYDLVSFERDLPLVVSTKFRRGLKLALDNALSQQRLELAGALIYFANGLGYREVQDVKFTHASVKNIHKYFHSYSVDGSIVDLLLQNIYQNSSIKYSRQLLIHLDTMLTLYERTKPSYENAWSWVRSQDLFLYRVRLESENIEYLTKQFIERVNVNIAAGHAASEEFLIFNIEILMKRLNQMQLQLVRQATVQWQKNNQGDVSWLFQSIANAVGK